MSQDSSAGMVVDVRVDVVWVLPPPQRKRVAPSLATAWPPAPEMRRSRGKTRAATRLGRKNGRMPRRNESSSMDSRASRLSSDAAYHSSGSNYRYSDQNYRSSGANYRYFGPNYHSPGANYRYSGPNYRSSGSNYHYSGPNYRSSVSVIHAPFDRLWRGGHHQS